MKTVLRGTLSIVALFALSLGAYAQATATLSQAEAVRQFPDLGKSGSKFNKAFIAKLQALKGAQDPVLSRDDWPMILAAAVANELGAKQDGKPVSTEGLPWPIASHTFTLAELNKYRNNVIGQIVWVKLWPTSIDAEPVGDQYKVFVKDHANDNSSDDPGDKYAFVWFPIEGAKKMNLIGKTVGGGLSFFVKVEADRLTAVARSRNIDSFHNTFTYTW